MLLGTGMTKSTNENEVCSILWIKMIPHVQICWYAIPSWMNKVIIVLLSLQKIIGKKIITFLQAAEFYDLL